ncbi:MAG: PAS domain S-box protein [Dehalococcoidia bacterium]
MKLMKLTKSTVKPIDEEELLKIMSDEAPVGVCLMQDGKICSFNSNFPVATGYTADELIGRDSLEIVVPEDREMVRENTIKMLKGKFTSPYQFRVINKDGSIVWIMAAVKSIQYRGRRAILGSYMEVTERKQLEETLKESEEKYRELANSITDVFFAIDEHLRYTYWNKASEVLTGIRAEDAIGKSLREIFPNTPGTRDAEKVYRNVLKTRQPQTFVNDFDIGGRHHIFEINAYPSRGSISVFVKDITERKLAEEKLKESEQKYRLLFETSPDYITQLDREGRYLAANPATARSLGVPLEELVGKTVFEVMPQEIAQPRLENIRKVLDEGQPQIFEDERAGRYFHHILVPTKTPDQKEAVQVIARDITERRKLEKALRQSEEKYKALFDSSVIGMFVLDAETVKIVMCNQAAAKMFGFSSVEEAIGINPVDFIVPEEKDRDINIIMKDMFEQDLRQTHEFQVVTKDGRKGWISATGARIMHEGRLAGLVSITNINRRKQAEEKLKESEQKYRTILEEMGDSYFEVDLAGNVTFVNDALIRILGYSKEEIMGMNYRALRPKEEAKALFEAYSRVYKTGEPLRDLLTETICKDGGHVLAETSVFPIRSDKGEIIGFRGVGRDITERKQAEEALRKSEERYRTILEEMEESYFESDLGGHFTFVNNSACRDLGYSKEELIGRSYKDHTAEDDIESVFRFYNEVYRTGVPNKGFPGKIIRKDGSQRFIETSISPRRNDKGEIIGFRGVGRDVTERKQTEEALRQSEEKYRTILENMEDAYSEVDLGGHLTFVNNSVCRDLGYSREELMGMSYKGFTAEDDIESVFRAFNEVYQTGVPNKGFPWKTTRKDGTHGFAETSVSPLRNNKGEIIGFRSVGRDVTERKETEEKLRQSRERYRALFDSSVIGTLVVDAETMKVVIGNQAAEKIFGVAEGEGAGLNVLDFIPPEDRERDLELLKKELFEQDSRRAFDVRAITKDSREIWISMTGARIMHGGRLAGLLSFADITERKQAEAALRQSEENYKTLFDSSVIGMYVLDAETMKIVMGNRASREMVGLKSEQEGIGINPFDFVVPEDREKVLEIAINEFFQDSHRTFEVQVIDKNGRKGWQSFSSARIMHQGRFASLVSIMDITERKQAEEALRQSEENYRALFDSAVIGTFVLDAETMKIVMSNQAAAKAFGFGSVEETIGVNPLDFLRPDDREKAAGLIAKDLLTEDLRTTHEFQAVTKDGRTIWISVTGVRIVHEGKLAGLLSFTDITERKQAEDKLQQSKENYRALFDSSVIGALVVDAETMRVVMANEATLKMFGFSSPEDGVNPFDFIPPEDRQKNLERVVNEVFGKDSRKSIDIPAVTKDGRKIWVSVTGARIMQKGKLAGLFSFTDITERKQAEEALRQSEENYRALFDSAVIGTVLLDAETMKIAMANQAAVKLFGFNSVEEALELDPFGFILPEDRERYLEITQKRVFEQNSHEPFEIKAVTKDGREIWINTTAAMIIHKGKLTGLISFADITEQKQQRERLMMTDRLASLGELASGTAHELNNPLTSIIGFSQLLLEREVPDDIREDLKLINSEAQRAASVTKNLLTFARKHAPAKQLNQINSIIEDVLKLRAYEHKVNAIEVERQLDLDLPEIMVDYFQIQQVFMNIVINAEYFMTKTHNKGTLTITTKKRNDTVMISVTDDGPGIPPENLRRIFDPFFTTKEAGKGTGLGLSICHGIVTEHGGQIYARSQLGKGATFFVELPINRP